MTWREEMAWAGGLFEGEGSFTVARGVQATAQIKMTDRDPMERFAAAIGFGTVRGPYPGKGGRKDSYAWSAQSFEKAQATVALLWPYLGERRKARAAEVLKAGARQGVQHANKLVCPKCGGEYGPPSSNGRNRQGQRIQARRCRKCQYEQQARWRARRLLPDELRDPAMRVKEDPCL